MSPGKEAFVAAAGPISSFILAAIAFMVSAALTVLGVSTPWMLSYSVLINIVLGVFNTLPLYPMDGGRILRAFCSNRMGHERGTKVAVWTTAILGGILCVASITFKLWSVAVIMPLIILEALLNSRCSSTRRS